MRLLLADSDIEMLLARKPAATKPRFKWVKETQEDGFEINVEDVETGEHVGNIAVVHEYDPANSMLSPYEDQPFFEKISDYEMMTDIRSLDVEPDYQGQGVAKYIYNLALQEIKKQWPEDPICINASPMGNRGLDLDGLIAFYQKAGFKLMKRYDQHSNALLFLDSPKKIKLVAALGDIQKQFRDLYEDDDFFEDEFLEYYDGDEEKARQYYQMAWDNFKRRLNTWEYGEHGIKVWRAISLTKGKEANLDRLGNAWAFDKASAQDYYGGAGKTYIFEAQIPEDAIDLEVTLRQNLVNSEEEEIRTLENSDVWLYSVSTEEGKTTQKFDPPMKTSTGGVGHFGDYVGGRVTAEIDQAKLAKMRQYTAWQKPTFEEFNIEMEGEEGAYIPYLEGGVEGLYKTGRVVDFSKAQIEKELQRGGGDNPPVEWLLDPNSVPEDIVKNNTYGDEVRYVHEHHKDGQTLNRFEKNQPLWMPIVGDYGNNHFIASSGRHRIAYAYSLGIPLKVFMIDGKILSRAVDKSWEKTRPKRATQAAYELYKDPIEPLDMNSPIEKMVAWVKENVYDVDDVDIQEEVEKFKKLFDPVAKQSSATIYRALNLDSVEEVDWNKFGLSWAFDDRENDYVRGNRSGYKTYLFTGQVNPKDIDWAKTLMAYLHWPEQNECRLKHGAQVEVTQVNGEPIEPKQAAAAHQPGGDIGPAGNPNQPQVVPYVTHPMDDPFLSLSKITADEVALHYMDHQRGIDVKYHRDKMVEKGYTEWQLKDIPVKDIASHRLSEDPDGEKRIKKYMKQYESGSEFPPIIVEPNPETNFKGYRTWDGHHRLEAARRLGLKKIKAYLPVRKKPVESAVHASEMEEYESYDVDWVALAKDIDDWVDHADVENFGAVQYHAENLPEDLRECNEEVYRGHAGTREGYDKLMAGGTMKVKAGSWSVDENEAAKFALGGNAQMKNLFYVVLKIKPTPDQVLINLQEAIKHPMLEDRLDEWSKQRIQDEGEVLLNEVRITKDNIVPLKPLAKEVGMETDYEDLFKEGKVSAGKGKTWPKQLDNRQLATHWEQMAYGDWGAITEDQIDDALDRVTRNYEDDTIWTLQKLKVADIEGHHSGHDASDSYIAEYKQRKQEGSDFPPIIVEPDDENPGKYKTIDGQHRLFAAKLLNETYILAYVPDEEAQAAEAGWPEFDSKLPYETHPMDDENAKVDGPVLGRSRSITEFEKIAQWYMDNIFKDENMPMPEFKIADAAMANWLGICEMSYEQKVPIVRLQKSILDDDRTMDRTIAHELIHVWQYTCQPEINEYYARAREMGGRVPREEGLRWRKVTKELLGHGETFERWAEAINKVKGKNYVNETSDETDVISDSGKEFFILIDKDRQPGMYGYNTFIRPTPQIRDAIKYNQEKHQARLFKETAKRWLAPKNLKLYGGAYIPRKPEDQKWLKEKYESGKTVTAITAAAQFKSAATEWNGKSPLKRGIWLDGKIYPFEQTALEWVQTNLNIPEPELADVLADEDNDKLPDDFFRIYRPMICEDLKFTLYDMNKADQFQDFALKVMLQMKPLPQKFSYQTIQPVKEKEVLVTDFMKKGKLSLSANESDYTEEQFVEIVTKVAKRMGFEQPKMAYMQCNYFSEAVKEMADMYGIRAELWYADAKAQHDFKEIEKGKYVPHLFVQIGKIIYDFTARQIDPESDFPAIDPKYDNARRVKHDTEPTRQVRHYMDEIYKEMGGEEEPVESSAIDWSKLQTLEEMKQALLAETEDDPDWSHLKTLDDVKRVLPECAKAAQKPYDQWEQDEDGMDPELGPGGICHLIVDEIMSVLDKHGISCTSMSLDSEVHVVTVLQLQEGIFILDIPWSDYERGGGYNWTKIPGVTFDQNNFTISKVYSDPAEFAQYTESKVTSKLNVDFHTVMCAMEDIEPADIMPQFNDVQMMIPQDAVFENHPYKDHLKDGRENEPHVTVLFGLENAEDMAAISAHVAEIEPLEFTIGEISAFRNEDKPYDVLKIAIDSPSMKDLHYWIRDNFDNDCKFEFNGHMTLAYIKKGTCQSLEGPCEWTGATYSCGTLAFSHKTDGITKMPMAGAAAVEAGANGDWKKEGITFRHTADNKSGTGPVDPRTQNFVVEAETKDGLEVANVQVWHADKKHIFSNGTYVEPEYRRKGIASGMYAYAEKISGKKFISSDEATEDPEKMSGDARRLWDNPNRSFGSISEAGVRKNLTVYRGIKDTWASEANRRYQGDGYWGVGTYYALDKDTAEDYATGDMTGEMHRWAFVTEYKFSGSVKELGAGEALDLDAEGDNPYAGSNLPFHFPKESAFLLVQKDDDYNPPEGGEQLLVTKRANVTLQPLKFWLYTKTDEDTEKMAKALKTKPGYKNEFGPFDIDEAKQIEETMKAVLYAHDGDEAAASLSLSAAILGTEYQDEGRVNGKWGSQASGIMFKCGPRILLLKRAHWTLDPLMWGIPGGAVPVDKNGKPKDLKASAIQEVAEEIGGMPGGCEWKGEVVFHEGKFRYTTFLVEVPEEFDPILNDEHIDSQWVEADVNALPSDVHPGVKWALQQFKQNNQVIGALIYDDMSLPPEIKVPMEHSSENNWPEDAEEPWESDEYNYRLNSAQDVWYAVEDGEVVGHLGLNADGWVETVYVDPSYRGEGIALQLYEAAVKVMEVIHSDPMAQEAGGTAIWDKLEKKYPGQVKKSKKQWDFYAEPQYDDDDSDEEE